MKNSCKYIKLGDICEKITKGTTPSTYGYPFISSGVNYIKAESITKEGRINPSSFVYISEEAHQKLKRSQIKLNDVLFTMAGIFLGKVAILKDKSMLPANTNQAVAIIRISYRCANPFYVYYFLQQDSITRYVNSSTGQSAQPNINLNEISNLRIRLPSIDIQNCIVNILRSLDDKIELNNKINRNLEAQAQAIFKSWFIDFEPFGGKMPADWKQGYLSDVLSTIESGSRPKGGSELSGVPSIGAENIDGIGHYDYTKEKYINRNFFQNLRHGKVNSGDVLLYKDGAYVGKVSMALNGFPHKICAVNEHVFILRTNECLPSQSYLYLFLTQRSIRNKISTLGSAKAAQPGVNQGDIKGIALTIPNQKIIQTFEKATSSIFNMIVQNSIQSRRLAQLRDTLLPKLMSGEIEVSDIAV